MLEIYWTYCLLISITNLHLQNKVWLSLSEFETQKNNIQTSNTENIHSPWGRVSDWEITKRSKSQIQYRDQTATRSKFSKTCCLHPELLPGDWVCIMILDVMLCFTFEMLAELCDWLKTIWWVCLRSIAETESGPRNESPNVIRLCSSDTVGVVPEKKWNLSIKDR